MCEYGQLPGRWAKDAHGTYRWTLFDPDCQLKDYISDQVLHPQTPAKVISLITIVCDIWSSCS